MNALRAWLSEREMPPYVFAELHGFAPNTIYRLLGSRLGRRKASHDLLFRAATLRKISDVTQIAVETLVGDACREDVAHENWSTNGKRLGRPPQPIGFTDP
jgi:hypothetical protein